MITPTKDAADQFAEIIQLDADYSIGYRFLRIILSPFNPEDFDPENLYPGSYPGIENAFLNLNKG